MFDEVYYVPTKGAPKLSLEQVAERFQSAGLHCTIEPEGEDMFWLSSGSRESNILANVKEGRFVFATFNYISTDPPSIAEVVESVMNKIGFSADEDADFE